MLTIHLFDTSLTPKDAVLQKMVELNERKKTDKVCHYAVTENNDGSEFAVDFLLGESKNDTMTIVEFNIYKYKQINIGQRKSLIVYAYSKRSYGHGITPFLNSLKSDRLYYLNQMIASEVPSVTIDDR